MFRRKPSPKGSNSQGLLTLAFLEVVKAEILQELQKAKKAILEKKPKELEEAIVKKIEANLLLKNSPQATSQLYKKKLQAWRRDYAQLITLEIFNQELRNETLKHRILWHKKVIADSASINATTIPHDLERVNRLLIEHQEALAKAAAQPRHKPIPPAEDHNFRTNLKKRYGEPLDLLESKDLQLADRAENLMALEKGLAKETKDLTELAPLAAEKAALLAAIQARISAEKETLWQAALIKMQALPALLDSLGKSKTLDEIRALSLEQINGLHQSALEAFREVFALKAFVDVYNTNLDFFSSRKLPNTELPFRTTLTLQKRLADFERIRTEAAAPPPASKADVVEEDTARQASKNQLIAEYKSIQKAIPSKTLAILLRIAHTSQAENEAFLEAENEAFLEAELSAVAALQNTIEERHPQLADDGELRQLRKAVFEQWSVARDHFAEAMKRRNKVTARVPTADHLTLYFSPGDTRPQPRTAVLDSDQLTPEQLDKLSKTAPLAHSLPPALATPADKRLTAVWISSREAEGAKPYSHADKYFEGITLFLKYCDKKPDPQSTMVCAGRWDLITLAETLQCCDATGRLLKFGENLKIVMGKNSEGNERGIIKKADAWVSSVKINGNWVADPENIFDPELLPPTLQWALALEAQMARTKATKAPIVVNKFSLSAMKGSYNNLIDNADYGGLYKDQLKALRENLQHKIDDTSFKPILPATARSVLFRQPSAGPDTPPAAEPDSHSHSHPHKL